MGEPKPSRHRALGGARNGPSSERRFRPADFSLARTGDSHACQSTLHRAAPASQIVSPPRVSAIKASTNSQISASRSAHRSGGVRW
jgi:hypothetical protein